MLFKNNGNIQESIKAQLQKSEDVVNKELKTKDKVIEIFYIKTISDETQLQTFLIKPFFGVRTIVASISKRMIGNPGKSYILELNLR
nr:hypothetical protein [Neobacillus sp. Marseille-Q6967]